MTEAEPPALRRAPTPIGWALLLVAPAFFLLAVNYGSNLLFALFFLILSLCVNAAISVWSALSRVEASLAPVASVFRGEPLVLTVRLAGPPSRLSSICLRAEGRCGLPSNSAGIARIVLLALGRGSLELDPPDLEIRDALGLFRVRREVVPTDGAGAIRATVWPRPDWSAPAKGTDVGHAAGRASSRDEWSGLRPWRRGDGLGDIAWKATARQGVAIVREHEAGQQQGARIFHWQGKAGADAETSLSRLAAGVLVAAREGCAAGVALPGCRIEPGAGAAHVEACLDALAGFGGAEGRVR
ncbi:MAG: DUF58 domain-containing protein [Pseudomonadota bacterium]